MEMPLALSFNLKNCCLWENENMNCLQSFSVDNFSLWNYSKTNFLTKNIFLKQFKTHAVWASSLVWLNLRYPLSFFSFSVVHPTRPRGSQSGREKRRDESFHYGRKSSWVPTLTGRFPKIQANAGSWLGTKNALYYCAQSANTCQWVLFVCSYMTAIVWILACLAYAPKK